MVNKMVKTANNIFWKVKSRDKVSPARLFADSDRDGVANVFDCRPFNKRRQDEDWPKELPEKSPGHRLREARATHRGKNYFATDEDEKEDAAWNNLVIINKIKDMAEHPED